MAEIADDLDWNVTVLEEYLTHVSSQILTEMTQEVASVARAIAPRRRGPRGGKLKASVATNVHIEPGARGSYGDIISLWYGRFLDPKAEQLHRLYPFLPTALYYVVAGHNFF